MSSGTYLYEKDSHVVEVPEEDAAAIADLVDEARFFSEIEYRLEHPEEYPDPIYDDVRKTFETEKGDLTTAVESVMAAWYDGDWHESRERALQRGLDAFVRERGRG